MQGQSVQMFPGRPGLVELLLLALFGRDDYVLMLDFEAEAVEDTHVDVGHPDEREPGDEIAAPAWVEKVEAGEDEEECGDVVREAVFAGEEVEEFSGDERFAILRFFLAELARLAEDLFVGDGPCGAGYWQR